MKICIASAALTLVCCCSHASPEPAAHVVVIAGGAATGARPGAATADAAVARTACAHASAAAAAPAAAFPASGSLYQRLGGQEGVTAIVREATRNHLRNPVHKTRFEVIAEPAKVERMLIEYFSQAAGGPVVYSGKNMVAAHRGMNLNAQEFLAFMDDIVCAMDTLGVGGAAKFELIGMMYRGKEHILHK